MMAVTAIATAIATTYLLDRFGFAVRPWIGAASAIAATLLVFVTLRRSVRWHLSETLGVLLVGGASLGGLLWLAWPALLPLGSGSDLTHHLILVDYIERHGQLPHDASAVEYLGEMADYTPGLHLLAVIARHDRADRRLSRALPCRRHCRGAEVRDLLSDPPPTARGLADPSAAVRRRHDRRADRLDLHARLVRRGFISRPGGQRIVRGRCMVGPGVVVRTSRPHRHGLLCRRRHCHLSHLAHLDRSPSRGAWRCWWCRGATSRSLRKQRTRSSRSVPIAIVALVHTIGRTSQVSIVATSGAVVPPSIAVLGWPLPLLSLCGAIVAAMQRRQQAALAFAVAIALQAAGLWLVASGRTPYMAIKMTYLAIYPAIAFAMVFVDTAVDCGHHASSCVVCSPLLARTRVARRARARCCCAA